MPAHRSDAFYLTSNFTPLPQAHQLTTISEEANYDAYSVFHFAVKYDVADLVDTQVSIVANSRPSRRRPHTPEKRELSVDRYNNGDRRTESSRLIPEV